MQAGPTMPAGRSAASSRRRIRVHPCSSVVGSSCLRRQPGRPRPPPEQAPTQHDPPRPTPGQAHRQRRRPCPSASPRKASAVTRTPRAPDDRRAGATLPLATRATHQPASARRNAVHPEKPPHAPLPRPRSAPCAVDLAARPNRPTPAEPRPTNPPGNRQMRSRRECPAAALPRPHAAAISRGSVGV
jgi:hypothetical protein